MDGYVAMWMGGWVAGWGLVKSLKWNKLFKIFQCCLKIYDLLRLPYLWMDVWVTQWLGGWINGVMSINKNGINLELM